ncbi:MAG: protein-disulfide reductase DsbD domain-containing protein [Bryobacteraceae bacterium]
MLSVKTPPKTVASRGQAFTVPVEVILKDGYHVNGHAPADDYLIPLRLSWDESLLKVEEILFPQPQSRKYPFAEKPLQVYIGNFTLQTRFRVPPQAAPGMKVVTGKLRYQACNDTLCLPPRAAEIRLPVEIRAK